MNQVAQRIGKYELVTLLGEGGMSRVYLAVSRGPVGVSKLVVVKQLRPEMAFDAEFVTMFIDEARIAARLSHPNVVQTYEVVEEGGQYLLAMEYLEGRTLAEILHRAGRANMPLEEHLWILTQVLAGLHYAHELADYDGQALSVVHRDVSPSNVFVTYNGEVKLVDFGIAKAAGAISATQQGTVKGKLGYSAPEQFMSQPVDARADVFSAGVMLWEAAAFRRRKFADTRPAILERASAAPSRRSARCGRTCRWRWRSCAIAPLPSRPTAARHARPSSSWTSSASSRRGRGGWAGERSGRWSARCSRRTGGPCARASSSRSPAWPRPRRSKACRSCASRRGWAWRSPSAAHPSALRRRGLRPPHALRHSGVEASVRRTPFGTPGVEASVRRTPFSQPGIEASVRRTPLSQLYTLASPRSPAVDADWTQWLKLVTGVAALAAVIIGVAIWRSGDGPRATVGLPAPALAGPAPAATPPPPAPAIHAPVAIPARAGEGALADEPEDRRCAPLPAGARAPPRHAATRVRRGDREGSPRGWRPEREGAREARGPRETGAEPKPQPLEAGMDLQPPPDSRGRQARHRREGSLRPMKGRAAAVCLLAALALGLASAPRAHAAAPADAAVEEARVRFQRGVQLFREGSFAAALGGVPEGEPDRALVPPALQHRQVQFELHDYVEALRSFRRYLAEGGAEVPADRREKVTTEIRELEGRVATVQIDVGIDGASVLVDDVVVGTSPLPAPCW
jgi:serine/threonine protein kinase